MPVDFEFCEKLTLYYMRKISLRVVCVIYHSFGKQ